MEATWHEIPPETLSGTFLLFYVSSDSMQMKGDTKIYIKLSLVELYRLHFVTTKLQNSND